eukprot:CAMPEP_0168311888 /NCGR_PEP_ID=MMETSP0142_2-20121227/67602_1 /TAXON_ID=44445 /ORGANISM="Pseudo-nitzschia australis, Strain 10249 10 AB" /LENGTH=585 /DNA_ID=CAMNT_0008264807 /DNA_START=228 /DNA_END=1985 /DNA_ORIENTATION=-
MSFLLLLWHVAAVAASSSSSSQLRLLPPDPSTNTAPASSTSTSMLQQNRQQQYSAQQYYSTQHQQQQPPQYSARSMGSPESIKLRPRIVSLNIMVAGLAGLGKTTTVRALLDAWTRQQQTNNHGNNNHNNRRRRFFSSLSSVMETSPAAESGTTTAAAAAAAATDHDPTATQWNSNLFGSSSGSSTRTGSRSSGSGSTKAIHASPPFEYFDRDANTLLRVRIIDTPGFGNRVNHKDSVKPITDYITECRKKRFQREQSPSTATNANANANTNDDHHHPKEELVHVCLYFLSPGRFLAIDRHFLKHVQNEVTIVPVIAKADTMTDSEIKGYRKELEQLWRDESIDVYSLDGSDGDNNDGNDESEDGVRGGTTTTTTNTRTNSKHNNNNKHRHMHKFHRGRRPGEIPAIVSRDGIYPWGHSRALDPEHSDLILIRDSLLSEHTERFLELAGSKYGVYRNKQLAVSKRYERLRYALLVVLVLVQLGRIEVGVNVNVNVAVGAAAGTTTTTTTTTMTLAAIVASKWASLVARVPLLQNGAELASVAAAKLTRPLLRKGTELVAERVPVRIPLLQQGTELLQKLTTATTN